MTDELTPEEKKAFENLPRERMPAGLEARVVGAMREHGFLARRRRMIELSNGRVTGLLAACVALMIGAYSIGLHRGDANQVLRAVEPAKPDDHMTAVRPLAPAQERKDEPAAPSEASGDLREAERSAAEKKRETTPAPRDELRQVKVLKRGRTTDESGSIESPATEARAPSAVSQEPAAAAQALRDNVASGALAKRPLTFLLNGTPVTVEAPDSVRVTQDEQGRVLLIYTSDGIIRIRLADNR